MSEDERRSRSNLFSAEGDIPFLIPDQSIELIAGYEKLGGYDAKTDRYYPFHGKADRADVLTIGRGHVISGFDKITRRFTGGLTLQQVNDLFAADLQPRARQLRKITGFWNINQFASALCGFYNCEAEWLPPSSVLTHHKRGEFQKAAEAMLAYHVVHDYDSKGQIIRTRSLRGLWRRQGSQALLYLTGNVIVADTTPKEQQLFAALATAGVSPTWPVFD